MPHLPPGKEGVVEVGAAPLGEERKEGDRLCRVAACARRPARGARGGRQAGLICAGGFARNAWGMGDGRASMGVRGKWWTSVQAPGKEDAARQWLHAVAEHSQQVSGGPAGALGRRDVHGGEHGQRERPARFCGPPNPTPRRWGRRGGRWRRRALPCAWWARPVRWPWSSHGPRRLPAARPKSAPGHSEGSAGQR